MKKYITILLLFAKKHKAIVLYLSFLILILNISSVLQYFNFVLHAFDYGLEHNVLYNTAQGNWFKSGYEVDNYLGDHFSPIILLYSPFYFAARFFFIGYTPLVFQNIAYIIGLLAIYKITLTKFNNIFIATLAVIISSIFAPSIAFLHFHYHPIALAFPFLLWGLYFIFETNKPYFGVILLLLAALGKEDVGLSVGFIIGAYAIYNKKYYYIIPAIIACVHTYLSVKFYIPYFRETKQDSLSKFSHLNISYILDFKTFLKENILYVPKINYFFILFSHFLYLPLFTRKLIILAPAFFANYLTKPGDPLHSGIYFHYDVVTSAILMYLFVDGLYNFSIFINQRYIGDNSKKISILIPKLILVLIFLSTIYPFSSGQLGTRLIFNIIKTVTNKNNFVIYNNLLDIRSKLKFDDKILFDGFTGGYFEEYPNARCFPGICGESKPFEVKDYKFILIQRKNLEDIYYTNIIKSNNFFEYYSNKEFILFVRSSR